MKNAPSVFIFSGELSGDMYGGKLLHFMNQQWPDMNVSGVGGPIIRSQGINSVLQMEDFQVMGFSDVLFSLPKLWNQFHIVRDHILKTKPDMTIFIDSPSFSLRMAAALRKKGYRGKIVQYICPTIWAWGANRIEKMAKSFDLLLTIFPFEEKYFANTSLKTIYIGNPIQDILKEHFYDSKWKEEAGIEPEKTVIALFPGSREGEIKRNLPILVKTSELISEKFPDSVFAISCVHQKHLPLMEDMIRHNGSKNDLKIHFVPKRHSYELMKDAKSAIAKSGTVTMELALHGCPSVVFYELSLLNKFIGKYVLGINLPFYCIVNIMNNRNVFPELIDHGCKPETLFQQFVSIHQEGSVREKCVLECTKMRSLFLKDNASKSAAQAIIELF